MEKLKGLVPNSPVSGIAADFTKLDEVQQLMDKLPSTDILVNNAGIFEPKAFEDIPDEDWYRFFEVNVMSGVRLSRHFFPKMIANNWGRIIFISSESSIMIPSEMIHYGMTKTAQLAVSRGLAERTKNTGVTVNTILPGPTKSEGVLDFLAKLATEQGVSPEEAEKNFFKDMRPSSLIQRFADVSEIASMIAYIASPVSAATNGAAIQWKAVWCLQFINAGADKDFLLFCSSNLSALNSAIMKKLSMLLVALGAIVLISAGLAKEKKKVIFFGDSITQAGVGPEGYITQLGALLQQSHAGQYELIGAGIGGNKVYDLYLRMEKDILEKKPDVVVIYVGINDVWHKASHRTGTDFDKFGGFYRALIKKIQDNGAKVIICTPSVIGEKKDGENEQDADLNKYSDLIRSISKDQNLPLVDLRKAFIDYETANNKANAEKGLLTTDRVHLNKEGNAFVAAQMAKAITGL